MVALKTLVVIHRLLREGDRAFREEFLTFTQRVQILPLSNFKDDSNPIAWDYSSWVRTYDLFLEEKPECFRVLKRDIEAERLSKQGLGPEKFIEMPKHEALKALHIYRRAGQQAGNMSDFYESCPAKTLNPGPDADDVMLRHRSHSEFRVCASCQVGVTSDEAPCAVSLTEMKT